MNRYRYKAMDGDKRTIRGKISAENPADLESSLKGSGLFLISYQVERGYSLKFGGLSDKNLITIFSHLEQLDKAGISVIDAVADVKDSSDSIKIRNLMQTIYESIKSGSLLSEAFGKHSSVFPKIFIGLIANGEKTGNLHEAFKNIVDHLKWNIDMKRKTVKAVRYPLFSMLIMFIVLGVMTTFVVPKVTEFLKMQNIALPAMTRALISFSDFAENHGIATIIVVILLVITYMILNRIPGKVSLKLDEIKLHIPLFGGILTKIEASRFCHFFAVSFRSGLGVLECLDSAKEVIKNKAIKESIEKAKEQVADGQKLAKSIAYTGHFPSLVIRMFEIGEMSGNIEDSLSNIRFFYDREINDSIDKMVGMIQPTLTLIMGGMMTWISVAVFGPIYSSFGKF